MKTNLFLIPFAGGSAYSYSPLKNHFGSDINFVPLELPGRGRRMAEPLLYDLESLADDLWRQVKCHNSGPSAIFGHSMGAYLAYLLACRMTDNSFPGSIHLFLSGQKPPHEHKNGTRHQLPKTAFINEINQLGGLPPGFLDHAELVDLFEPVLRADYTSVEVHHFHNHAPLKTPVTVLCGDQDSHVTPEQAKGWQNTTCDQFQVAQFNGGHFFLFEQPERIGHLIQRVLHHSDRSCAIAG
ncbi:MAG: thioesterase [Magnetococcales bacterium]|nr:thioesterase [Magnetococcales bacterium]